MPTLAELIKQETFASPAQEAMLNVLVTYPWLTAGLTATMVHEGLTPSQYNVLRILRGAHPERVPCSYIGERLLDRTPDVTRLLNRLQRAGLVERRRAEHDGRVVEVGLTEVGQERLRALDAPVGRFTAEVMSALSAEEQSQLSQLLEKLRCGAAVPAPAGCAEPPRL